MRAGAAYTVDEVRRRRHARTEVGDPLAGRAGQSAAAAAIGFTNLHARGRVGWQRLWAGRIDVLGNPTLATEVNASQFYLWSSTRAGSTGASRRPGCPPTATTATSSGTPRRGCTRRCWPSIRSSRPAWTPTAIERLAAARSTPHATGNQGARFPWESALDGTEQIPPPVSINSEGLYEQHITADIALAQWQYYLATGDRQWLAQRGWPVLAGAATFWAGRATAGADGSYHLNHVTGPDEENPDVNDEAYTNVAAATTLRIATARPRGARPGRPAGLGAPSPTGWSCRSRPASTPSSPATRANWSSRPT